MTLRDAMTMLTDAVKDHDWQKRYLASAPAALNDCGYDPFGFSPSFVAGILPFVRFLYRTYFRVECTGIENIPKGPVLLVSNHSGQIPIDGALIATALLADLDPPRMVRSMVERWAPTVPFASIFLQRCGQVTGTPENFRRILASGEPILVFPEGVRGISKTIGKRYQLQEFAPGFMRLALEKATPIVPVAVVGCEEAMPSLHNSKTLARLTGAPAFPLTPTFPWLLPLGLIPYPVKVRIVFGEPMVFEGDPNDDDAGIGRRVRMVKSRVATLIRGSLAARRTVIA